MSNYNLLLSEVRLALDEEGSYHNRTTSYGLTATLPCNHDHMEYIDIPGLYLILDEFNLLSFDFQGPWDNEVGVNSPLYDPIGREGHSISSCVLQYAEGGASRNKINIGLAFYGHSFKGGKFIGDQCTLNWAGVCADIQTWQQDRGTPQYHNIYSKIPEMALSFDLQTMTPLASNDQGVVSFDDPKSICLKTEYAMTNALNGVVVMDLAADMLDDGSTPLLDAMNLKILQPDISCRGEVFDQLFQWREVVKYNPYSNNGVADASSNEASLKSYIDVTESNPSVQAAEPRYRYTCGAGEGNAKDRCTSHEMEDISCEYGTCPTDLLCFVVLCTKPREGEVREEPEVQQKQSVETSFSKSQPMRKPRPIPVNGNPPLTAGKARPRPVPSFVETSVDEEAFPVAGRTRPIRPVPNSAAMTVELPVPSAATLSSFSCGVNHDHAKSCGKPCPNGLIDCPNNQFCFWLKCDPSQATSYASIEAPAPAKAPSSSSPTAMQYHCGETRVVALTCSEECGFAWQCPEGKDCYNVPCTN